MKTESVVGRRWVMGGAWVLMAGCGLAGESETTGRLKDYVIDANGESPAAKVVRENLAAELATVKPQAKGEPLAMKTKDGQYVLAGDLFKTGNCFALFETTPKKAENPSSVALAEWAEAKWQLRGLWKMPVLWLPVGVGWDGKGDSSYYPVEPFHEPFELSDLSGDGVPEVLIAGEVGKYFTSSYLLKYAPESHGLDLLGWTKEKPKAAGTYIRFYENSGHRAIWQEWTFFQWMDSKLVEKASWHSESPYLTEGTEFLLANVTDKDGRVEKFRITNTDSGAEGGDTFTIIRDEQPFAKLVVAWRNSDISHRLPDSDEVEHGWLFEKITGISREHYPLRTGIKEIGKLEAHATVRVEGSEEAVKRLSLKK